jgi:hypothetical protein
MESASQESAGGCCFGLGFGLELVLMESLCKVEGRSVGVSIGAGTRAWRVCTFA